MRSEHKYRQFYSREFMNNFPKAAELLWVLDSQGPKELETYKTPELTWEEVKYIQEVKDEEAEATSIHPLTVCFVFLVH